MDKVEKVQIFLGTFKSKMLYCVEVYGLCDRVWCRASRVNS